MDLPKNIKPRPEEVEAVVARYRDEIYPWQQIMVDCLLREVPSYRVCPSTGSIEKISNLPGAYYTAEEEIKRITEEYKSKYNFL